MARAARLRGAFALICAVMLCAPGAAQAEQAGMTAKRHGAFTLQGAGGDISVNVPVSGFRDMKLFTLSEPYRVVLDIATDETFYAGTERYVSDSPFVKEVRTSHKDGIYRFVCEPRGEARLSRYGVLKPVAGESGHVALFTLRAAGDAAPSAVATAETAGALPSAPVPAPRPDRTAAAEAAGAPPPVPVPVLKPGSFNPTIVIDAGHGGRDPGASGSGKREKKITLDYATFVVRHLRQTGRYKARLTREKDIFIPLHERVQMAENIDADFFISLHADSLPSKPELRGFSVYTLSETASDREAEKLAEQENASGTLTGEEDPLGDDITDALVRLVQRDTMNRSAFFAEEVIKYLPAGIPVLNNTHRFAGFRVLTSGRVPSALVELGFLSNARDARMLGNPDHKAAVAEALTKGLDALFYKK